MKYYVEFVGISGSGKSSTIEAVQSYFDQYDPVVYHHRKTGEDALRIDEEMKQLNGLLRPDERLAMIIQASRVVVDQFIEPALQQSKFVIGDRGRPCAIAHLGAGEQLGEARVEAELERAAVDRVTPHRTILLDVTTDVAFERRAKRADGQVRIFDDQGVDFQRRVRFSYIRQAMADPERFQALDATEPQVDVIQKTLKIIEQDLSTLQK